MNIKQQALITAKSEFTPNGSNTEMVKFTILCLPEMIVDEFYKTKAIAKQLGIGEPSSTEVVDLTYEGVPSRLRVTNVKYTGKTFTAGVK